VVDKISNHLLIKYFIVSVNKKPKGKRERTRLSPLLIFDSSWDEFRHPLLSRDTRSIWLGLDSVFGIGYFSCKQSLGMRFPGDPVGTLNRALKHNLEFAIFLKELCPDT
jgi:hypothetical protein